MSTRGYCLFCLDPVQPVDNLDTTKTFLEFLEIYTQVDELGNLLEELELTKIPPILVLDCYEKCKESVDGFCEVYHKIKCLEIELDGKLNKLVKNIELTDENKNSSKWHRSNALLANIFYDDWESKDKCKWMIRQFRESIRTGHHKLTNSQSFTLANRRNAQLIQSSGVPNAGQLCDLSANSLSLPNSKPVNIQDNTNNATPMGSTVPTKLEHGENFEDEHETDVFLDGKPNTFPENLEQTTRTSFCADAGPEGICEMESSCNLPVPDTDDKLENKSVQNCVQCGETFNSKNALQRHSIYAHAIANQSKPCSKCPKMFRKQRELNIHMESHKNPEDWKWQCKVCDKKFITNQKMKKHMKIMHIPRPTDVPNITSVDLPSVELNGSELLSLPTVKKHSTCDSSKKIKCEKCGGRYKSEIALKMHNDLHHSKKKHSCQYCGKKYDVGIETIFNKHVELCKYPEKWEWSCENCDKKYMYEWQLVKHMKTHFNEKSLDLN